MTDANLFTRLDARMKSAGQKPAFLQPDGFVLRYDQLRSSVGRFANALAALGVKPGDRVMVQAEKSLTAVCVYLAVLKIGAVYNPLNTAYTVAELDYFIGDAEPSVIIVSAATKTALAALAAVISGLPHLV